MNIIGYVSRWVIYSDIVVDKFFRGLERRTKNVKETTTLGGMMFRVLGTLLEQLTA